MMVRTLIRLAMAPQSTPVASAKCSARTMPVTWQLEDHLRAEGALLGHLLGGALLQGCGGPEAQRGDERGGHRDRQVRRAAHCRVTASLRSLTNEISRVLLEGLTAAAAGGSALTLTGPF